MLESCRAALLDEQGGSGEKGELVGVPVTLVSLRQEKKTEKMRLQPIFILFLLHGQAIDGGKIHFCNVRREKTTVIPLYLSSDEFTRATSTY